jgi:hypothetical protein
MKTPEELADEHSRKFFSWDNKTAAASSFLTGYQAAKEHAHAALEEAEAKIQELEDQVADGSKVMNEFDAMLEEKELVDIKLRDAFYRSFNFLICNESIPVFRLNDIRSYVGHLEDVLAARNSPEKPDGSNSSNNSNGWISVKERLPEEGVAVLVYGQVLNDPPDVIGVRRRYNGDQDWKYTWESEDGFILREDDVTHWMPLPKPPEKP